ncbi:MAG: glycosyltransferase family 2 protein [Kiritimatiellia bacterium]|nr:glycosyltransferase family 2 protein [Kiritimatiellia bacterium]
MLKKTISVVIPIYNEQDIIARLMGQLKQTTSNLNYDFEFIFVNDGSSDNTLSVLIDLQNQDEHIKIIDLSRNFGQQVAISAGIDYSNQDAVVLMDADLEDCPHDIPKFIEKWEQGYDVVYALRKKRKTSVFRNICFYAFHSLNRLLSDIPIEPSGIFGLMDKRVVERLKAFPERKRYFPGLRNWVGFKQTGVVVDRGARYDAKPRVSFARLVGLALDGYFSFSNKPLKVASLLGIFFSFLTLISAILIVILKFVTNFKVPGWASMIVIILFISSMQFVCIGIIGEYLGRMYDEIKGRPLYIINGLYGLREKEMKQSR